MRSPNQPSSHHPSPTEGPSISGLYVQVGSESEPEEQQVFPLKHTEVQAQISGHLTRVEVTQMFENPYDTPLEAVYVFPLPDEAAVDEMEITLGDRTIRGEIKRRQEAREIYEQAVQQGRTAGLLEQQRDNIFTQSVANIRPGEQIQVTIRYTESLKFQANYYEFVFPMVVGPRYIPGGSINPQGDTDEVPDASQITPPVVPPGERSGQDIRVTVEMDAGVPIQEVRSPSHEIQIQPHDGQVRVQLAEQDHIPNKDLILRYRLSGEYTQATVLTQMGPQGGHFALYLIPAVEYRTDEIVPKDVVFLMDTSGSQQGDPLIKSQELMRRMINGLNPDDTFAIIDFANTTTRLSSAPLPNTPQNRQRAIAYVNQLMARGGTELLNGIRAVLNFPAAEPGRLRSVVLLTDGYIGNDTQVIAEVQQQLPAGNRLYSFGVGSSVNRFLLNRLAEVGRGTVQVVRHDEPAEEVAERFFQQINNPVLTHIQVEWQGPGDAPELYPLAVPDLFTDQPLVLFGRKPDGLTGNVHISGITASGQPYEVTLPVNFEAQAGNRAIAQLWGRARIKDLMNQLYGNETVSGVEAVTQTALDYQLLSQYTAFVAVSEDVRVEPDGTRRTVQVPVEMPEGVSYEGIFGSPQATPLQVARMATMGPPRPQRGNIHPSPSDFESMMPTAGLPLPYSVFEGDRPTRLTQPPTQRVTILEIEGLESSTQVQLERYLQRIQPPAEASGEVAWEIRVHRGRIERILLNDQETTLEDQPTLDLLRRSLHRWQPPSTLTGTIRIRLAVQ